MKQLVVYLRQVLPLAWLWLAVTAAPANAQVLWDDYQGTSDILGTSNQDKPGPYYNNNVSTSAQRLANLRAIASDPSNATRTGTSPTIDFSAASATLCNISGSAPGNDPAGTGPACQADAQGRVMYAIVKFPAAGTYSFTAAHDDEIAIELSTDYANTNYRNVSYDVPVGTASGYTASETTFETLGSVTSTGADRCAILRFYWNNAGGNNWLHLHWVTPGNVDQVIPAAQFLDPSLAASSASCTGTVSGGGTVITLNKAVGATGRSLPEDQFSVGVYNGATAFGIATTSGSGTGQQASTGAIPVSATTTYTLNDAMAAGSTSTLASYLPAIACKRNGAAFTPGGSAPNWTVSASPSDQIVCTITNTRRPPLTVVKTSMPVSDPYNSTSNPKFVPGGVLQYFITVTNPGGPISANSVAIVDPLPTGIYLYVGNVGGGGSPASYSDGSPSSTLTYTFGGFSSPTDDLDFSSDHGASWSYVPVADGQGFDKAVTAIRVRPNGTMAAGSSFVIAFQCGIY